MLTSERRGLFRVTWVPGAMRLSSSVPMMVPMAPPISAPLMLAPKMVRPELSRLEPIAEPAMLRTREAMVVSFASPLWGGRFAGKKRKRFLPCEAGEVSSERREREGGGGAGLVRGR